MKKKKINDERVNLARQKVDSEALKVVLATLIIMLILQYNAPLKQVMGEFIVFIVLVTYLLIRSLMTGLDVIGENKGHIKILVSLLGGLLVAIVGGVNNYSRYGSFYHNNTNHAFILTLLILFISGSFLAIMILEFLSYMNKRKQKRIKKA